jgi:MinD-like ATPase involved in chromosome partitioning or flagellar assembly
VTHIVTFYSFKGGVGRTMALVNTAHALAKQGARVLMVDFDLEAPGMTHFFSRALRRRRKGGARDALDLLLEAKRRYGEIEAGGPPLAPPLTLADYVLEVKQPHGAPHPVSPYFEGRVDLLPATLESRAQPVVSDGALAPSVDYLERIAALDLPGIFGQRGPGHLFGKHVGDCFRHARFKAPGDLVFALRDPVQAAYDFVLVDSRTGLNEISGLCIGPLSDSLVICTGLNEQNVSGTRYFLEKAGLLDPQKGKPYLVVVGPVPPWRTTESATRIAEIKRALVVDRLVEVPYHPAAALAERVFVLDEPVEAIAGAFELLAREIAEAEPPAIRGLSHLLNPKRIKVDMSREVLARWREVAESIPTSYRFFPPAAFDSPLLPPFPTILESVLLQHFDRRRHSLGSLAIAIAVAIYRHLSEPITKRSIELLNSVRKREERTILLLHIAFFFTRLHGKRGNALLLRYLDADDRQRLSRFISGEASEGGLAGLALRLISGKRSKREQEGKDISKAVAGWLAYHEFPAGLLEDEDWSNLWQANYSTVQLVAPETADKLLEVIKAGWLTRLVNLYDRRHPGFIFEVDDPPGFSLELTAASVMACTIGPAALKEIIQCIEMGRLMHGYGWRVMINWERLEPIRSCPEFKSFIAEEDAAVEEVETRFEQGIWPQ